MPIKIACKCGQKFAAKDELSGKTVKCPKCGDPIKIPAAQGQPAATGPQAQQQAPAPARQQPKPQEDDMLRMAAPSAPRVGGDPFLNDLLVEAGVTSDIHHTGPRCPGCNAPIQPDAMLCVKCGYNLRTGQRMRAQVGPSSEFAHLTGSANAEDLIKRAEEEIAERPIETSSNEYGDMLTASLLTGGLLIVTIITVGLGYVLFRFVDVRASSNTGIAMIMVLIGTPMYTIGVIWILVLAFMEDMVQGLLVLLCPCYVWYWCFTHMGSSPVPVMLFCVGWMMYTFGGIMFRIGDSKQELRNPVPIERTIEQDFACLPPTRRGSTLARKSKFNCAQSPLVGTTNNSFIEDHPCELPLAHCLPCSLAL